MLTVAYCRVSTEEQAAEGFSIEGQADRLRQYAELHELGPVMVISDPGRSGKDLNRPGLLQLMAMIDEGHVQHVLVWRLDRLSRNLGDLIGLADRFGQADVALHSFTEKLDLSSATGRMFYNILGAFAQFYREQLGENVRMGVRQAAKEGRWTNHPPTGYDLVDGVLIPNADSDTVRRIYRLRAESASQAQIASATGVNRSTVLSILRNPAYRGLVKCGDEWLPGLHEPLISEREFTAAHRGRAKGQRRGRDLMSGRVRCGGCGRSMSVMDNGAGWLGYRCWNRGEGCKVPRFSNVGLLRAALLGLALIGRDTGLQTAIRAELERRTGARRDTGRRQAARLRQRSDLETKRRKLLELFYADKISQDLFSDEERRLAAQLSALDESAITPSTDPTDLLQQFEKVAQLLASFDFEHIWAHATETEKRTLLDEFVPSVEVHVDHLTVQVRNAPTLNVALHEVGLRNRTVENGGVGGGT